MKGIKVGFAIDRTAGYRDWRREMQQPGRPIIREVDLDCVVWREDADGVSRPVAVIERTVFDGAYPMHGRCLDMTRERVQKSREQLSSLLVLAEAFGVQAWLVAHHIGDMRGSELTDLERAELPPIAFWIYNLTHRLGWFPARGLDVGISPAAYYRWLEKMAGST